MTTETDALPESLRAALILLPCMAASLSEDDAVKLVEAELIRLTARVQELERERDEWKASASYLNQQADSLKARAEHAEADLAAVRKRIAEAQKLDVTESGTNTYINGGLSELVGKTFAMLPLDDEAKS